MRPASPVSVVTAAAAALTAVTGCTEKSGATDGDHVIAVTATDERSASAAPSNSAPRS
ncbi:hypothetical protein SUDANB51_02352 [Streptomyces sp. enrichment culture]